MTPAIRLLYVDDEHDLLDIGKLFLEESGDFSVVTIDSAPAALELLGREQFDAIISDYQMPGMDGIRLLVEVRKHLGKIPFILFTGKGREEVVIQAINSGADFYLQKGGEPSAQYAELSHKIRMAVDRLQSENTIAATREKYRVLFETITDAVFLADGTGKFLDANQAACLQLGYEKEELLRLNVRDVSASSGHELGEMIRSVEQTGSTTYETVHRHRDRSMVPVELTITTMDYGGKQVFLGVARDITGRKRSEDALRESEKKFRTLAESSPDYIMRYDRQCRHIYMNPAALRVSGLAENQVIGKTHRESGFGEEQSRFWEEQITGVFKTGKSHQAQFEWESAKGRVFLDWMLTPEYSEDGTVLSVLGVSRDITGLKSAEEKLHASLDEMTRTELALKESKQELSDIIEFLPDATFVIDLDGRVIAWNRAMEEMTAISKADMIGKGDHAYTVPFYGERRRQLLDLIDVDDDEIKAKYSYIRRKGHTLYAEVFTPALYGGKGAYVWATAAPLFDMNGDRIGAIESIRDITEWEQADTALRENEERFRSIIQNATDIIRIIDKEGHIVFDTPSSSRILGYPENFTIGKSPLEFVHPDDREPVRQALDEVYEGTNPGTPTEFRIRKADGSYIFVETVATNLLGLHGVNGIITTTRPVDERRKADDALRESDEKNRAIISSVDTGIILQERSGKILAWNREAERIFGITSEEMIGKTSISRKWSTCREDGSELSGSEHPSLHTLATGEPCRNVVIGVMNTNGRFSWITVNTSPLFRKDEPLPYGVVISFLDITGRKRTEEALRIQHDLSLVLNRCTGLGDALDHIVSAALRIEGLDAGGIYLADPLSGALDLVAHKGLSAPFIAKITHFEAGAPQVRQAKTGTPQYGTYAAIRPETDAEREKEGLRAIAYIPVLHDGNLIAVMNLASHTVDEIPLSSRHTLETLALWVGSTLARIRSRQVLEESEERFRSLFDNIQDPVMVLGFDGGVHLANNAVFRLAGIPVPRDVGPLSFAPFLLPEWQEKAMSDLDTIRVSGGPLVAEYQMQDATGEPKWVEAMGVRVPWMGEDRDLVVLRDSTKRKNAEDALRQSEMKYRLIADNTADNIWIFDMDVNLQYMSPAVSKMRGFTVEEALAQSLDQMMTPASVETVLKRLNEEMTLEATGTADPGRTVSFETEEYCKDGSTILVENSVNLLRDPDGSPVGILGISRDITGRKSAEKALRESEYRFRAIFDSTFQFIALLSPDGRIMEVNESALHFGGFTLKDVVGKPFWEARWWTMSTAIQDQLKKAVGEVAQGNFARYEVEVIGKDTRIATIDFSLKPVMDTSGTVISLVAEGRDITERRKAEEALRAVNKKLKLLSGITRHDILNNVTVMLGFLELARDHSKHPEMERFIGRLETKTRQIRSQIQFTQLYEDIGSHEPQWQDLHQELAKLQLPPGITFSDNCTIQEIFADGMLEKVFCNLLDNSVRHGGYITQVVVSCHESDAGLTITWEDDGSGVPQGEKEKIFERGFGKNTGLGLFLVREILDITGITIRETGRPGEGARFEITVPDGKYRKAEVLS